MINVNFRITDLIPGRRKARLMYEQALIIERQEKEEFHARIKNILGVDYFFLCETGLTIKEYEPHTLSDSYKIEFPVREYDYSNSLSIQNNLVYGQCDVFYHGIHLSCTDPIDIIPVVNFLRDKGINIPPNQYERIKLGTEDYRDKKQISRNTHSFSENVIYKQFINAPTQFELFCSDVFEKAGFKTKVTPPSDDGGFDIILYKNNEKTLVECKCYNMTNPVGRPVLQKLVGANMIEKADHLFVVTTGGFSSQAREYAKQCNIQLIDGKMLVKLCEKYDLISKLQSDYFVKPSDDEDWWLTRNDILPYYPIGFSPRKARQIYFIDMEAYLISPKEREIRLRKQKEYRARMAEQGILID